MDLNLIWFVLVGVLIAGYAVLDGFDLGVGVLSLFGRSEAERRVHLEAIGPFWDGNEVWLLTGGGALFAAFPYVYATIFSGFYLALMLLLVALIARAVSLEYRFLVDGPRARRFFDVAFGVGSLLPAVLFGVAVGNVLRGVPVTAEREWAGTFLGLLNPYAVLVGLVTLAVLDLVLYATVVRPVSRVAARADEISRGQLDVPELPARGHDEISILAAAFNRMHLSLVTAMKLLEGEKPAEGDGPPAPDPVE